jgi:hypothetical protein
MSSPPETNDDGEVECWACKHSFDPDDYRRQLERQAMASMMYLMMRIEDPKILEVMVDSEATKMLKGVVRDMERRGHKVTPKDRERVYQHYRALLMYDYCFMKRQGSKL